MPHQKPDQETSPINEYKTFSFRKIIKIPSKIPVYAPMFAPGIQGQEQKLKQPTDDSICEEVSSQSYCSLIYCKIV